MKSIRAVLLVCGANLVVGCGNQDPKVMPPIENAISNVADVSNCKYDVSLGDLDYYKCTFENKSSNTLQPNAVSLSTDGLRLHTQLLVGSIKIPSNTKGLVTLEIYSKGVDKIVIEKGDVY